MDQQTIAARTAEMQALSLLDRQTRIMRSTNVVGQGRFISRCQQIVRDKLTRLNLSPPGHPAK